VEVKCQANTTKPSPCSNRNASKLNFKASGNITQPMKRRSSFPPHVYAEVTNPGGENDSGAVVCAPDVYLTIPDDCLPTGPSTYITKMAKLGLIRPCKPPTWAIFITSITFYFDKACALHGDYWQTRFGYPQSRGCVNLSVGDAHWLFNWAVQGDWVYMYYPTGLTPTDLSF